MRQLAIATGLVLVAGVGITAVVASPHLRSATNSAAEICITPAEFHVGGHEIRTPMICIPAP
jgi:hypothetical protein